MNLQEYINRYYDGDSNWFAKFTNFTNAHVNINHNNAMPYIYSNQERIANILNIKEYLSGKHAILNKGIVF